MMMMHACLSLMSLKWQIPIDNDNDEDEAAEIGS